LESIPPEDDYWHLTRRPLNGLLFLVPLLLLYEYGVHYFGGAAAIEVRNGADYWMRSGLAQLGLGHNWLLPVLPAAGLLIWQVAGKYRWKIAFDTFLGMLAESLLFAMLLVLIGRLMQCASHVPTAALAVGPISPDAWKRAVGFVGAGIYEEFLFRLCLLPLLFGAIRLLRLPRSAALAVAIVADAALFAAAHYVGPGADAFDQFTFLFRSVAGMYFALLCVSRGFGITVGAHAAYDLLVGLELIGPVGL
jgi:hypothetical protein